MKRSLRIMLMVFMATAALSAPVMSAPNMLLNPRFEDLDGNGQYGDYWGSFGAASFNNFFGIPHASLWGDRAGNWGGVFQTPIIGYPDTTYQFDLLNLRIEPSWDADLYVGLEYYDSNDTVKLGETLVLVDTAARIALGQIDGNVVSMKGTAVPPDTVFVRPIVRFDNVNSSYSGQPQANCFLFDTYLSEAPKPGQEYLKNPGFEEKDRANNPGYYWGTWGNISFNDFWGGNAHASFWADQIGNFGGLYQASVLGTPGDTYRFALVDVRIEENFDADMFFGIEYYGADNYTKIGERVQQIDTGVTGNGLSFQVSGTAVAGTVYVRPVIRFDNVGFSGGSLRNAFVFTTALTDTTGLLWGDMDCSGQLSQADITPFVLALINPSQYAASYPGCSIGLADMNGDAAVNGKDIALFVQALIEGR
jgi:hypothetical protein